MPTEPALAERGEDLKTDAPVQLWLANLAENQGALTELLDELERRLAPVLAPLREEDEGDRVAAMPDELSPTADRVRSAAWTAGRQGERVRDLLRRLEV